MRSLPSACDLSARPHAGSSEAAAADGPDSLNSSTSTLALPQKKIQNIFVVLRKIAQVRVTCLFVWQLFVEGTVPKEGRHARIEPCVSEAAFVVGAHLEPVHFSDDTCRFALAAPDARAVSVYRCSRAKNCHAGIQKVLPVCYPHPALRFSAFSTIDNVQWPVWLRSCVLFGNATGQLDACRGDFGDSATEPQIQREMADYSDHGLHQFCANSNDKRLRAMVLDTQKV